MSATLTERIAQEHAAARDVLPSSVVSPERRREAIDRLVAQGLPTARDENWKYANLRGIEQVKFGPGISPHVAPGRHTSVTEADLPSRIAGHARYVFVDGVFAPTFSAKEAPAGVTVTSLQARASANDEAFSVDGGDPDARFAWLNEAFATDGARFHAARGAQCTGCVEFLFVATQGASAAASYPRLELHVEASARIGLIERHISVGDETNFVNAAVHVTVDADAQVDHYRLQQSGAGANWFETLTATVGKGARYTLHAVNLGALSARSTIRVRLAGEHAETALHVVCLADGEQVHDGYALVEHIAPHTKSEQNVRGIAAGRARVAFNSKVVVQEHAKGTDSRQSLRGLLAGSPAEIDMRPQLEIYTDDVRCNHGATAGKLDENMLYYLLSRGIEREIAQQLLKWAFLEDVVSHIAVPELRKHIEQSLAGQMRETAALKELV